ncbi:MAG: hypothetical protein AAF289_08250 [Cyanobacteria bacterium P01_A01_bin.135]
MYSLSHSLSNIIASCAFTVLASTSPSISDESITNDNLLQVNWLISILGAILLSILGNLATTPAQNLLARFSKQRARKRVQDIKQELVLIENYRSEPLQFISYSVESLLRILLLFGLAEFTSRAWGILERVVFSSGIGFYLFRNTIGAFELISLVVISYFYVKSVTIILKVLKVFKSINSFSKYKSDQELTLSRLEKGEEPDEDD